MVFNMKKYQGSSTNINDVLVFSSIKKTKMKDVDIYILLNKKDILNRRLKMSFRID
ncbi:MAG: hypothetical protein JWO58_1875 [Chitinophagaceae bacterium]|nr:hypothetical protein [Chitinophagaceae bacterium]